jgi:hypothetical protein
MRAPRLTLSDLARGLDLLGAGRYQALCVFADDLLEARSLTAVQGLRRFDEEGSRFLLRHAGGSYELELSSAGVVRLKRVDAGATLEAAGDEASLQGRAASESLAAVSILRGKHADSSPVLGLLVGNTLDGSADPGGPRRVFTLEFEPSQGAWRAYTGGLVPWMKARLLASSM